LCLHQIYSLGSGSRELYQNADRSRGVLIGSLRGLGLLSSRLSVDADAQDTAVSSSAGNPIIHSEWIVWATRERKKRTAWASFEFDCSLCTLTSRRGAVDLNELPPRLPCADSLWEAPSGNAWLALRSRLGQNAMGVSFSTVIGAALASKPVPEQVSSWGKRLCAQVIGRLLWDLKQLEIISLRHCLGLASLSSAQQQPKASLLLALDNLLKSMDNPISTIDLISYK
jgi:Fungal specific transcription factor domain